jgi:hypothetical protein
MRIIAKRQNIINRNSEDVPVCVEPALPRRGAERRDAAPVCAELGLQPRKHAHHVDGGPVVGVRPSVASCGKYRVELSVYSNSIYFPKTS